MGLAPLDLRSRVPIDAETIANLGAGNGDSDLGGAALGLSAKVVCVELFGPYCDKLRAKGATVVQVNAVDWIKSQKTGSFDVVLMIDFIEHLDKPVGMDVILHARRIATKRVVMWVPLGDCHQEPFDGNEAQRHVSTWYAHDFPGAEIEVFPEFHRHTDPWSDASWVIYEVYE